MHKCCSINASSEMSSQQFNYCRETFQSFFFLKFGKAMANYPQELAQDAVCQSHTGHMTGLWFLPARPLRLNTNERMNS